MILKKLKRANLKVHWPVLVLGLIWLCIAVANTDLNSLIIGWDSVHSEFNTTLNVQRVFSGAWQEYRGLGLTAGMAEIADISRVLFVGIASLVIPLQ